MYSSHKIIENYLDPKNHVPELNTDIYYKSLLIIPIILIILVFVLVFFFSYDFSFQKTLHKLVKISNSSKEPHKLNISTTIQEPLKLNQHQERFRKALENNLKKINDILESNTKNTISYYDTLFEFLILQELIHFTTQELEDLDQQIITYKNKYQNEPLATLIMDIKKYYHYTRDDIFKDIAPTTPLGKKFLGHYALITQYANRVIKLHKKHLLQYCKEDLRNYGKKISQNFIILQTHQELSPSIKAELRLYNKKTLQYFTKHFREFCIQLSQDFAAQLRHNITLQLTKIAQIIWFLL